MLAVGASVTRALEAASATGVVRAVAERTSLLLGPDSHLRVCDGLLTGMHEPGTSHYALLEAVAPRALLDESFEHAGKQGHLAHELGDSCLSLRGALSDVARVRRELSLGEMRAHGL